VGSASDWLREERRKTLGDWVAVCAKCGHGQRYFEEIEDELDRTCPTCSAELLLQCPACQARISSMFTVACEECETPLREPEQFGSSIRRKPRGKN